MIETPPTAVEKDIRTEEERFFDSVVRTYAAIPEPIAEKDNPNALFANGWGRRGHFALLVAPSGVGKSVISTQLFVPWSMGKPGLIGSAPLIPMRIAVIQAEDDDTEMAEFRRDHRLGHLAEGWTKEDIAEAEKRVWDWSPFFRAKVGDGFLRGLEFALMKQPMDVVIMNPLQSYTDIDLNKNKEITDFLRNGIDPILVKFRVFMLCVHHTNKPQIDRTKGGAFGDDAMAAYVGAGGAELTNYARSVTFIRRCSPKECKVENSFMLIGAKRGNRLGWKDEDGKKTNRKIIAYSEEYIHWRVPKPEEIAAANSPAAPSGEDGQSAPLEPLTPEAAADMIAEVVRAELPPKSVWRVVYSKLHSRVDGKTLKAGWECFTMNHKRYGLKMVADGNNSYHFEPAPAAEPQDLDGLYDNDSQPDYGNRD